METNQVENQEKHSLKGLWKSMKMRTKIVQVGLHLFAFAGAAILGAWACYQLGFSNNSGAVDNNNRYLANYEGMNVSDSAQQFDNMMRSYLGLAALSKVYPNNAELIYEGCLHSSQPDCINKMLYAANMYLQVDSIGSSYTKMVNDLQKVFDKYPSGTSRQNLIPWMNDSAWDVLKTAILKDREAITKAGEMTGVEPRMIVACLVGEQIRLFNSSREKFKTYLGPMKVLSVQSQFSLGVNGIKDFTAMAVERNLKDSSCVYYMGPEYEHLLDFKTEDVTNERINRLVDYHDRTYSYLYTACILKQTMLQWKRAGYDISDRPDILFTLFNLGFQASKPNPEPRCGGSRIQVCGKTYTFGVIGYDFYYSGELMQEFPILKEPFFDRKAENQRS